VIDRTGLILEIFGERAATAEGRLQVELAHLDYQAGRLVRSWTHLERQRGGFGFLGGPGETQIEADRRPDPRPDGQAAQGAGAGDAHALAAQGPAAARALAGDRAGRLHQCRQVDAVQPPDQRRCHGREPAVCDARPDHAEIPLPGFDKAILSDTVGFISELPTQLVAAFRATLEEVISADLIIHVRDISHPDSDAQREDVERC
jgi:GTP-binding protein HflX